MDDKRIIIVGDLSSLSAEARAALIAEHVGAVVMTPEEFEETGIAIDPLDFSRAEERMIKHHSRERDYSDFKPFYEPRPERTHPTSPKQSRRQRR